MTSYAYYLPLIDHILAQLRFATTECWVSNFLVTFLLLTTNTALQDGGEEEKPLLLSLFRSFASSRVSSVFFRVEEGKERRKRLQKNSMWPSLNQRKWCRGRKVPLNPLFPFMIGSWTYVILRKRCKIVNQLIDHMDNLIILIQTTLWPTNPTNSELLSNPPAGPNL